jgi:hypothetical protein
VSDDVIDPRDEAPKLTVIEGEGEGEKKAGKPRRKKPPSKSEGKHSFTGDRADVRRRLGVSVRAYRRLVRTKDVDPLYATLATAAGLPHKQEKAWLRIIGAASSGKTELVRCLVRVEDSISRSTVTEAGLLSASGKKDRTDEATGGLLKEIGERGILVVKDFTSILTMNRETIAQVMAAFREMFDGEWTRAVGTDGGRSLGWTGRLVVVVAVTPAIDHHHTTNMLMGERFMSVRVRGSQRKEGTRAALDRNTEAESLRSAFHGAVAELMQRTLAPEELSDETKDWLVGVADFVSTCRSTVYRDGRSREIEDVHDPEYPARAALELAAIYTGCLSIGARHDRAKRVTARVARDSMPPTRWRVLEALFNQSAPIRTSELARKLSLPTTSARRALEDVLVRGIVVRTKASDADNSADTWALSGAGRIGVSLVTFRDGAGYAQTRIDTGFEERPSPEGEVNCTNAQSLPTDSARDAPQTPMDKGIAGEDDHPDKPQGVVRELDETAEDFL